MEICIRRLAAASAAMFIALAVTLGYWQIVRAPGLIERDDNPRRVLAEQAIVRGTIFDRHGVPLALTQKEQGRLVRRYPEPQAEPLLGYYSLQHGVAWAEAAFDARLRGLEGKGAAQVWWDNLLHKPQSGQAVTLTLDMAWQRAAHQALGDSRGVVLVAEIPTGYLRACASRPTFDPNRLEADWDRLRTDPSAPLLNRAAQGTYQPGSIFQTVVLEEALRTGLVTLTATVPAPAASIVISQVVLGCARPPEGATWADVYAAGCPGPWAGLADALSVSVLEASIRRWQLDAPVDIGLPKEKADAGMVSVSESDKRNLVLGQGRLTLTPLHVLRMVLMLANDGRAVPLSVVASSGDLSNRPHPLRAEEAATLRSAWRPDCGWTGVAGLAASGTRYLAWYMGIGPVDNPQYALVVLVEDAPEAAAAHQVACRLSP